MNHPDFSDGCPIKIDRNTGRIAMQAGTWYDGVKPPPHIGFTQEDALAFLLSKKGTAILPHFQGGYTITSGYLDERSHLIVLICSPKQLYRVSDDLMERLQEESIMSLNWEKSTP